MNDTLVLVLTAPGDKDIPFLSELQQAATTVVGDSVQDFAGATDNADIIFNWSGSLALLRDVFLLSPRLCWVHSRSAGLEQALFPELVDSEVILTNGSGVFSPSLGEFALGAILYFAKDFRRMIRNQEAGRWEQFDITEITGQTVGIVGYGDIGRAVATRVRAMGMRVLAVKRHGPPLYNVDPLVDRIYSPEHLSEVLPQ